MGTNTTQTLNDDCLIGELERVIKKENPKAEIVPDENIILLCLKHQQFLMMKTSKQNKK